MSIKITKKQKRILDFIYNFTRDNDYSPSYREIASGLGLRSPASVSEHIDNLVQLGALRRAPGSARSLELVDLSFPETTALFATFLPKVSSEDAKTLLKAAEILGLEFKDQTLIGDQNGHI